MTVDTARQMLPVMQRLDWRRPRLSYVPRSYYGDPDNFRERLRRRLHGYMRRAWPLSPRD